MKVSLIYPFGGNEWNEAMEIGNAIAISVVKDVFTIEFEHDGKRETETFDFKDFPVGTMLEITHEEEGEDDEGK